MISPKITKQPVSNDANGLSAFKALTGNIDTAENEPVSLLHAMYTPNPNGCYCRACNPFLQRMILCPRCGNKRCPKAESHTFKCTQSNATGQIGELE